MKNRIDAERFQSVYRPARRRLEPGRVDQCIWMPPTALPLPARAGGEHKPHT